MTYKCYECGFKFSGNDVCEAWVDGELCYLCGFCHTKRNKSWDFTPAQTMQESGSEMSECNCRKTFDPAAPKVAEEHTLYILMRTDLASMNPGKAMAQAAHAGQHFQESADKKTLDEFNDTRGFGRTIVLELNDGYNIEQMVHELGKQYHADFILDPTYPLQDGRASLAVPVITCAYVFVPKDSVIPEVLQQMILHY